jgi:hypothetical protein
MRQSHFATDGRSVSMFWCGAPSGAHDQMFVNCSTVTVLSCSGALSNERAGHIWIVGCFVVYAVGVAFKESRLVLPRASSFNCSCKIGKYFLI